MDDFNSAFRSSQGQNSPYSTTTNNSGLSQSSSGSTVPSSGSKPSVNVFHSLTTRSNYYCNLPHPQSNTGYVADPVTEMCNQAERAVVHDLEAAASRARSLGCSAPLDAVTGFETGCHLSGESNVVLLIGWKTVHPIALPSVDEMFNWAEVLERTLIGELGACASLCVYTHSTLIGWRFARSFLCGRVRWVLADCELCAFLFCCGVRNWVEGDLLYQSGGGGHALKKWRFRALIPGRSHIDIGYPRVISCCD